MRKISRALISVSDKTGILELASGLTSLEVELLSTGGTAKLLREKGLKVRDVSDLTGFPEMLDGRVKTLHPKVHGGLSGHSLKSSTPGAGEGTRHRIHRHGGGESLSLRKDRNEAWRDLGRVDREYRHRWSLDAALGREEFRGCHGSCGRRRLSRGSGRTTENRGSISRETRARLGRKAFATTAAYDSAISTTLQKMANGEFPETLHLNYRKVMDLRYGENPHQKAALYRSPAAAGRGLAAAPQLQGKELSYNNLVDLEAAWRLVQEFEEPTTVIIKHTNPCGVATGATLVESYQRALEVDPVSAFGSVIAFNRAMNGPTAEELSKLFVEAVVSPGFEPAALERLAAKKNLRLLDMSATTGDDFGLQFKALGGGLLVQTPDSLPAQPNLWKCVTDRQPSPEETEAMIFAWRVVKHVKSNAIVFARRGVLVGVGAGQMSRVDSVKLGITKARDLKHALEGTVLASDAFFPFPDGVEEAVRAGVTAIVQPGGSVRDNEVIAKANQHHLAMVLTGVRHFSH